MDVLLVSPARQEVCVVEAGAYTSLGNTHYKLCLNLLRFWPERYVSYRGSLILYKSCQQPMFNLGKRQRLRTKYDLRLAYVDVSSF
jgi:hypothetical protein